MKKIYICAPYKGNVIQNIANALGYSKWVYRTGSMPMCVHCYLELVTGLHERNGDRDELLWLGKEIVKWCDEIWVFGKEISSGMNGEIEVAKEYNIPIKYIKDFDDNNLNY